MRYSVLVQLVMLTALLLRGTAVAQQPELIVEVDRQQLYEGESLLYRVTVNNVARPSAPELKGFDAFTVAAAGEQQINFSSLSIINGRRTEVVRRGRQFDYRLTPTRSGRLTIPAPTATIDGKVLTGRTVDIQVIPPTEQDLVILSQSTDRTAVYPMQPFTVLLTVAVQALPKGVTQPDQDPLTVQRSVPALTVPWLDDERLGDVLQPQRTWRQILEPNISRRGHGFQINNIGSSSAFSFFENRAAGFHPPAKRTQRTRSDGTDGDYFEYQFQRTFVAAKAGPIQLGGVTLKGAFANSVTAGRLTATDIYAVAPSVTVQVKDVPQQGRPESFVGAVGTFEVAAELTPTDVSVGDPLTLTVTLTGQGTLDNAYAPAIGDVAAIADNFRTYDATEESGTASRRFIYSLRPLSADVTEFPPVPVSWFDVEKEEYVTEHTSAISLNVREAETLSGNDIVSSSPAQSGSGPERSAEGVFANVTQLRDLRDDGIRPTRWFAAWGISAMCWVIGTVVLRRAGDRLVNPAAARRRAAPRVAAAALDEAQAAVAAGEASEAATHVRRALNTVIAAWSDTAEDSMTPHEAVRRLEDLGVDESLRQDIERVLTDWNAVQYSRTDGDNALSVDEVRGGLNRLIAALRGSTRGAT